MNHISNNSLQVRLGLTELEHQDFEAEFLEKNKENQEISLDIDVDIEQANVGEEKEAKNSFKTLNLMENSKNTMENMNPRKSISPEHMARLQEDLKGTVVKKAYLKLKSALYYIPITALKNTHFAILNDRAYFQEDKQKRKTVFILNPLIKYAKKFIINPYSYKTMLWRVFTFFFTVFLLCYVPLEISFHDKLIQTHAYFVYLSALIVTISDVIMKINTGIFKNGCLVKSRRKILQNYFDQYCFYDLISLISIIYALFLLSEDHASNSKHLIKLIIFLKIHEIVNLYYEIFQYFRLDRSLKNSFELLKIFSLSLFFAHIVACLWHFVSILSKEFDPSIKSWVDEIDNISEWKIAYVYSLYWSIVTMMTVGYGDISPKNPYEVIFSMIALMVGCAVYAYNLNGIGMILQKMYKESSDFHENISIISEFMEKKKIDKDLNMRVREYLKFLWQEKKSNNNQAELEIINTLNNNLKEELLLEAYGGIFKALPMLYQNFSEKSLKKMVSFMKEQRYTPGDIIFQEKETDDCSLFYITNGCVDFVITGENMEMNCVFNTYKAGEAFGENSFFTGRKRNFTARCKEYVKVFEIKREDFIKILKENPADYEKFCMIKDQITFYQEYKNIKLKCIGCGAYNHSSLDCKRLQFKADIEKIVKKHEFSFLQERKNHLRSVKKYNTLNLKKDIENNAIKLQTNLKNEKAHYNIQKFLESDAKINGSYLSLDDEDSFPINYLNNLNSSPEINEFEEAKNSDKLPVIPEESTKELEENSDPFSSLEIIHNISNNNHNNGNNPLNSSPNSSNEIELPLNEIQKRTSRKAITYKEKEDAVSVERAMKKRSPTTKLSIVMPQLESEHLNSPNIKEKNNTEIFSEFFFFEKHSILKAYFPCANIDEILKNYHKKTNQLILKRKILNKEKDAGGNSKYYARDKLQNLGKYCFFPEVIKKKILKYKEKIQNNGFPFFGAQEKIEEKGSPLKKSLFFKRQEFQMLNKENFATFVSKAVQKQQQKDKKKKQSLSLFVSKKKS